LITVDAGYYVDETLLSHDETPLLIDLTKTSNFADMAIFLETHLTNRYT
jgi:hypothetical protein